ncbi:fatty-acid amide hydrolase 1 [Xiphophorus maculatus]|uniref:Fatty-acid amide hydrolase 1 n=1 Tax=Xiphophorus maculatus TaxID=8083 RepID=M4AFJ7_XIPMA|nr:fatty-acid amide hydrolase 1 [Xiphophorus maculatus]XP_023195746.1 fatty-acid amide hydrolase 1 [Xiphophorus maculatus]
METLKDLVEGVKVESQTAVLLTSAVCGVGALLMVVQTVSGHRAAKDKIQRARNRRTESLQRAEQEVLRYKQLHPSCDSAAILSLSLSDLTKQLREGSLCPEDVFYSYMQKTLAVHKKLNCCTEILLESFDQLRTIGSNKDGLLYGVPISIKENVSYKNCDCTCGVIINLSQPAKKDSVIVEVLKKQGAIPFTKTNLPQALLNYDCSNPIFGQTINPYNPQKTSGGSSGGEGALIGGGGSILGIGSDIGGSIRIPASFCGICGFKPTTGRLSSKGIVPIYRGQKCVLSSPGPLARDVDSLALCMQALLCDHMFSLDPTVPPLPFNLQTYQSSKPLRIGYLEHDGYTQPPPCMIRGLREVKALLEQAGHTVVPYEPLRVDHAVTELIIKGVLADGAATMLQKLKGGPVDPCLKPQIHLYSIPLWLKRILKFLLKPFSPRIPPTLGALCGVSSAPEVWKQHADVEDYISETIAHWRKYNIDVLLCPMIGPAFNFLYCGRLTCLSSLTMIYNLLNFPAGAVPVSTVTAQDEEDLKHLKGLYQDTWDKLHKLAVSGAEGLPVAVQCVALPWQDELCLRFMKEVEQLVKHKKN